MSEDYVPGIEGKSFEVKFNQLDRMEITIEKRYFTPEIEDIRVGYECEWRELLPQYHKGDESDWTKLRFTYVDPSWIGSMLANGDLRVPYLTKEQIEAEGWKPLPDKSPFTSKPYKWRKVIGEAETGIFNEDHIYTLEREGDTSYIKIHLEWESSWMRFNDYIFVGTCKDINTLRYITKLLNINP